MLRAIMPKIVPIKPAKHDTIRLEQSCGSNFLTHCPPRRAISCDRLGFFSPQERHRDRGHDCCHAARSGDDGALGEDLRDMSTKPKPPDEKCRWRVERDARHSYPGLSELRLKTEAPGSPLRRGPRRGDHDQYNDEHGA